MSFRSFDYSFSSWIFGQTIIFQIFSVKRPLIYFVFGQMTFFGQMNFRSNGNGSHGVRSNELSVKWPLGNFFSVKWFFGKVIQNPRNPERGGLDPLLVVVQVLRG
jgi:hypothetical protein